MKNIQINHAQKGFTLIELMIVVAIIGILAAIAIPQYQDYIARTQVNRVFGEISAAKTAVEENLNRGSFGFDSADIGMTSSNLMDGDVPTVSFTSADSGAGTITAEFGGDAAAIINGNQIRISRTDQGNWTCTTDLAVDSGYVPAGCTGGGL